MEFRSCSQSGEISCTKLSGKTPTFPFSSPFHQPLSGKSLLRMVMTSPSFKSNSSSFVGLYAKITLHSSRTERHRKSKWNEIICVLINRNGRMWKNTWFWWQTWRFFLANGYRACWTNQIFSRTIQTGSAASRTHSIIGCADVIAATTIGQYWRRTAQRRNEIRWKHTDFASQFASPPSLFDFAQKFNDVTDGQCELIVIILRVTVNCFESAIFRFRFIAAIEAMKKKKKKKLKSIRSPRLFFVWFIIIMDSCRDGSYNNNRDIKSITTYRKTTGLLSSASKTRTKLSGNMPVLPVAANVPSHQPPGCTFTQLIMAPLTNVSSSVSFAL